MKSKIETYLGFCIRSRAIAFGVDETAKLKIGYLLLVDEALGESSFKEMNKARERLKCPMYVIEKDILGELLHRFGVKAVTIKDKNLASAILSVVESEPQFKLYSGGSI